MTVDSQDLSERVALVTGAGTGIGRAIAARLAAAGAAVGIHFRSSRAGTENLAAEVTKAGGHPFLVEADLTRPDEARDAVDRVAAHFGRLDILVNGALIDINGGRFLR